MSERERLTSERLQELRRIAAETTPGTHEWRIIETSLALTIETALALLDRIEALEAFVWAEHAIREHASTCVYWGWKPGACPNGVCGQLEAQREEAYLRALEAMGIKDSYKPLNYWEEG